VIANAILSYGELGTATSFFFFTVCFHLSECFKASGFIAVVLLDDCGALLDVSKSLLMELDGELVHIGLSWHWFCELSGLNSNPDLDWNLLSKWSSLWTSEGKEDFIDLVSANHVVEDSQWNLNLLLVFSLDLILNWNVEDLNWDDIFGLLVTEGNVAA